MFFDQEVHISKIFSFGHKNINENSTTVGGGGTPVGDDTWYDVRFLDCWCETIENP